MINETILAARALSHNEVHNVVGDNTEPVIPKTKPTVKSLANENHFIFLNMMPINKDKMIGIKNQIITSLYSIFAYNVANNRAQMERSGICDPSLFALLCCYSYSWAKLIQTFNSYSFYEFCSLLY